MVEAEQNGRVEWLRPELERRPVTELERSGSGAEMRRDRSQSKGLERGRYGAVGVEKSGGISNRSRGGEDARAGAEADSCRELMRESEGFQNSGTRSRCHEVACSSLVLPLHDVGLGVVVVELKSWPMRGVRRYLWADVEFGAWPRRRSVAKVDVGRRDGSVPVKRERERGKEERLVIIIIAPPSFISRHPSTSATAM